MRNNIYRLLSVILTLTLLLGLAPSAATVTTSAASDSDAAEHIIYYCDFSTNPFNDGWSTYDWDADGYAWDYHTDDEGHFYKYKKGALRSASWVWGTGAVTPDNVVYSPYIDIPSTGVTVLRFWARGTHNEDFMEKFAIGYKIDDGNNVIEMFEGEVYLTGNAWREYTVDISAYGNGELKGKRLCIIIRHYDCTDQFYLAVDDFRVTNAGAPVSVYSFDFESNPFENGWREADIDKDGNTWIYNEDVGDDDVYPRSFSGRGAVYSESYSGGPLTPNNRLWSPYFTVPSDGYTVVSFMARGSHRTDFAENFCIAYSELLGDAVPTALDEDRVTGLGWTNHGVIIPNHLNGRRIRICIIHYKCTDQNRLYLDDFNVDWYPATGSVYSFNFESATVFNGWSTVDADNDGNAWLYQNDRFDEYTYVDYGVQDNLSHSGSGAMFSASWWDGNPLQPFNLLAAPPIYIPDSGTTTLSVWARAHDQYNSKEKFTIVATNGEITNTQDFIATAEWKEYTIDVSEAAGRMVQFVIIHYDCTDQLRLYIDDFSIKNTKTSVMKGDLDKDGEISVGDALIALRIAAKLVGMNPEDLLIGDVDGDNEITVGDSLKILRVAAKLEDRSSLG